MKRLLLLAGLFLAVSAGAQTVLLYGDYPDPTVLKDGDDYYMTHSAMEYRPGFLIWHSRDLVNWEPICRAAPDWKGSAWAPDLKKVGDTYYLYFPSAGTNWVVTAKDIRGPWSKPCDLHIGGIDPGLAVTPEGKRYLFTNDGYVTPLSDDGLSRAGETVRVYTGWEYPSEWEVEGFCLESPKLFYKDGYYHLVSAQGGTAGPATSHMVVTARSKDIAGPWENNPYNPLVHTYSASEEWWSKGHGTLVEGPGGQWWVIYHAYRKGYPSLGRHTLMEPVEWTERGWCRPVKDLEPVVSPEPQDLSDEFFGTAPGWQWSGWKENSLEYATVKGSVLTLQGKGKSPKDGRLLTIVADAPGYSVQTEVTVGRKDASAGLLLFYDENAYAGLSSDGRTFTVYLDANRTESYPNKFGRKFSVRLDQRGGWLDVSVSKDGLSWETLRKDIPVSGFQHNIFGGFFALRPSLYSAGSGKSGFRHFRYVRNPLQAIRKVVFDTDWWTDVDDACAIRILLDAERRGEIVLEGICLSAVRPTSVPSLSAFLLNEGRSGLFLGADKEAVDYPGTPSYHDLLIEACPGREADSLTEVADAVEFYRKILSRAEEPVDIITVGFTNSLERLLRSGADRYSPLSGTELVRRKVRHLWSMAGKYPEGKEYNFANTERSHRAGATVCDEWPTPVTFLGYEVGTRLRIGGGLPEEDLLHKVLAAHGSASGRYAWDPLLTWIACLDSPQEAGFETVRGTVKVDPETGADTFTPGPDGPHEYVVMARDSSWYAARLGAILGETRPAAE